MKKIEFEYVHYNNKSVNKDIIIDGYIDPIDDVSEQNVTTIDKDGEESSHTKLFIKDIEIIINCLAKKISRKISKFISTDKNLESMGIILTPVKVSIYHHGEDRLEVICHYYLKDEIKDNEEYDPVCGDIMTICLKTGSIEIGHCYEKMEEDKDETC